MFKTARPSAPAKTQALADSTSISCNHIYHKQSSDIDTLRSSRSSRNHVLVPTTKQRCDRSSHNRVSSPESPRDATGARRTTDTKRMPQPVMKTRRSQAHKADRPIGSWAARSRVSSRRGYVWISGSTRAAAWALAMPCFLAGRGARGKELPAPS